MAILVYQTIPVGDEHFFHLKLSFVSINLHSWWPRDWNAPHEKCSSLLGKPPSEIWRGFCIQSGYGKFEKRLLLLQNVIIKSIYLKIVVPKSTFELRQSSVSRGRSEQHIEIWTTWVSSALKQVRQSSFMNLLSKLVAYCYGSSRLAHLFLAWSVNFRPRVNFSTRKNDFDDY